MVDVAGPRTFSVDLDFLEGWEALNALLERRARLDAHGEPTLVALNQRAETKLRDALGIPVTEDRAPGEWVWEYGK